LVATDGYGLGGWVANLGLLAFLVGLEVGDMCAADVRLWT